MVVFLFRDWQVFLTVQGLGALPLRAGNGSYRPSMAVREVWGQGLLPERLRQGPGHFPALTVYKVYNVSQSAAGRAFPEPTPNTRIHSHQRAVQVAASR